MPKGPNVVLRRLGHRPARDKRVTTHVCLTARAFGASKALVSTKDASLERSVRGVVDRFGGDFEIETGVAWRRDRKGRRGDRSGSPRAVGARSSTKPYDRTPPGTRAGPMRPSSVVLALSFAIVLASLSPRSAAVMERPAYARGDFWSYPRSLSEEFGFRFEGNSTVTAGSEVETDVQGERVRALEVSVSGGGTFEGTFEGVGTVRGG